MTLKKISIPILLTSFALSVSFPVISFGESRIPPEKRALESVIKQKHGSGHGEHGSHVVKAKHLEISTAWTRATVKTAKVGGGYITIKNTGDEADRLITGSADFANHVHLHEMTLVDDVMRMRPLEGGIVIPAGGEIVLKPGAQHLMFMGLQRPLVKGEKVTVSLTFEKAGDVPIPFKVNSLAAKSADEHSNHSGH